MKTRSHMQKFEEFVRTSGISDLGDEEWLDVLDNIAEWCESSTQARREELRREGRDV